jgi:dipeptidyl-peptidase-3
MRISQYTFTALLVVAILVGCGPTSEDFKILDPATVSVGASEPDEDGFVWQTEQFEDLKIVRYQIPGWEHLSERQQSLVYCLNMAGLSGRDMMYDQNNRYNLRVRNLLEKIHSDYDCDRETIGFDRFETYLKRIWFSNGIHHHYSNKKHIPEFSREYFEHLLSICDLECSEELMAVIMDPLVEAKKVELDREVGLVEGSSVNFYGPGVTTEDAEDYFESIKVKGTRNPVEYGLNSRLVKTESGEIVEEVYKIGGLYNDALVEVISWLRKAHSYTENHKQAVAMEHLIEYYETGDLEKWSLYNVNWVKDTEGDVDYINGFIEVYNDPLGYTGSYETIVEIKDFDASARMATLMENAQWFEDHMPFFEEHKKTEVIGITYNVVNVAGEAGDASPSTPIGVNLPNSNWIRQIHGSKSVSLGNIVSAYAMASGGGMLAEFAHDEVEVRRVTAHSSLAGKLHTAMHEVIGHASGKLEEGVATPKETILEYSSTLEEGRADLVALYFLLDEKLIELGLMKTIEVGRAEYDSYIRGGMMTQVVRLDLGDDIEEAHMRNRAWVSNWCYEKGLDEGVIKKYKKDDGKTYIDITDYEALQELFGELLREVQRIKSQGDYAAAKALVEGYGVKVDPEIHAEVLERSKSLGIAPYGGFINPQMEAIIDEEGVIIEIVLTYPSDFTQQMLYYSNNFSFLPEINELTH